MQADSPQQTEHSAPIHRLWDPSQKPQKPDNLYRLRTWVTHDNEERGDCQCQTFTFKSLDALNEAMTVLKDEFEGTSSSYKVKKCGVGFIDEEGRVDKGKMQAVVIDYDTLNSSESWNKFIARLNGIKKEWTLDS